MKLDKLYKALKDGKSLIIEQCTAGSVRQWAGCPAAMYALPGLPVFTPETLLAAIGVSATEFDMWNRSEQISIVEKWLLNYDYGEQGYASAITIDWGGRSLQPIDFPSGTFLVRTEHLKPLFDSKEPLRYFMIKEKTAILVCDGIFPVALIMPWLDRDNNIADAYKNLADGIRKATTTLKIDHPEYFKTENKK